MKSLYGKENLTRLIKEAHVGPGTVTRIKEQETSVGVDVLEKISTALKVAPWQLLHPTLGVKNDNGSSDVTQHAITPEAVMLASMLDTIKDPIERLKIMAVCVNVIVREGQQDAPRSQQAST